jgi:Family of unknown function (DUF5723)
MKRKVFLIIVLMVMLFGQRLANANHYNNARSLAMAKSFTSLALNYQVLGVNPANLALQNNGSLGLEFFSAGVRLSNNSFSLSDYNNYNGEHLSQADKDDILSKVPVDGLEGSFESGLSALSFSTGSFAVGLTGNGNGNINLDREILELIFNGNSVGDSVDVSNAFGTGIAHADFNVSYGAQLKQTKWGTLNWGINLKYIYGLAFAEVEEAQGYISTQTGGINSEGAIQIKTSEGGSGFGMDVGFSAQYKQNWVFSLAVTNLISKINWNKENQLKTYSFAWSNWTVENSDDDSLITSDEFDEEIGSFSKSLAPQLAMGASTSYKSLLVSFDFKQGFSNLGNVSTKPQFSIGCEAGFLSVLPLRAGVSLGGIEGSSAAVGFGLNLRPFYLDFAYTTTGSLTPTGGKGIGLAVSSGLIF